MSRVAAVGVPFRSAETAWWWAWDTNLLARSGLLARRGADHPPRLCTPAEVISLGITPDMPLHPLAVLAHYGQRGYPPEDGSVEADIWSAAMVELEAAMQLRGWLSTREEP